MAGCYNQAMQKNKTARPRQLAKFVCPNVGHAVLRPRLFEYFEVANATTSWVHGPPGSGKTTLVANYLQSRKLTPVWYQVDSSDTTLSTFFYFLTLALEQHLPNIEALPLMAAESREDWLGYAKQFFRTMLLGLTESHVLVFDNLQDANGALDGVLAVLAHEPQRQQRVIFTSHKPPPTVFLDLRGYQQLTELNADALQFDISETALLINSTNKLCPANDDDVTRLHTLARGWAAGIVLLSTQAPSTLHADVGDTASALSTSHGRLFDYFLAVVIQKMSGETRAVVDACAFLPDFDATLAIAASGNATAPQLLEALHHDGLFVEVRHDAKNPIYQFHGLLASVLRDQIGPVGSDRRKQAMAHAGNLLAGVGRTESAIALLLDGGDFENAAAQILNIAESSIAENRLEQLAGFIEKLPLSVRAALPWLNYYLGLSLSPSDENSARVAFSRAYAQFERDKDAVGCTVCAAAIVGNIEAESSWQSYKGFTYWGAMLQAHWLPTMEFPNANLELRAFTGLVCSKVGVKPTPAEHSDIPERAIAIIPRVTDAGAQLKAAKAMCDWFINIRDLERALFFENFINYQVQLDRASPALRAEWLWALAEINSAAAQVLQRPQLAAVGDKYQTDAIVIAETYALSTMKVNVAHAEAARCIWTRNSASVRATLDSVESLIQIGRVRDLIRHAVRRSQLALLDRKGDDAWMHISRAVALSENAHYPDVHATYIYSQASQALAYLERYDEAIALTRKTLASCAEGTRKFLQVTNSMLEALKQCDATTSNLLPLAALFEALREARMVEFGRLLDPPLAKLCAVALSQNIESDFVRELIQHRKFMPPMNASAHWPWPLKIEALGGFKVSIASTALTFEGKSQKKPLEMLQIVVTMQDAASGLGPKVGQVMDELWPSLEAKDPQGSFDTTLHRLRKLIGIDGAIVLADGRLSFNRALVWCDVAAFETLAKDVAADAQAQALKLYTGALFDSTVYAWSAAPRERLAARYHGLVEAATLQLEAAGDYHAAIALYERALQQDNLAEVFYRGLMRCYHALGEDTQALLAYRRCKGLLSIVLGATPSRETEALWSDIERLRGGVPATLKTL